MRLFLASLLLPLIAVIVLNASINAGGLGEHEEVKAIAAKQTKDELMSSEIAFDQRAWLEARLTAQCPDVLAMGSSTIGRMREDLFRGQTLINGWLGGGLTGEDYEAVAAVLKQKNCVPKTVVFGADLWSMGNAEFTDQRWTNWFDAYVAYHDGDLIHRSYAARIAWARFTETLNFTTTRESAMTLLRRVRGQAEKSHLPGLFKMTDAEYCQTIDREHTIRAFDGHYVGCPSWEHSQADVEEIARNYLATNAHGLRGWLKVDDKRLAIIAKVVEALAARGSKVTLVGLPFHPVAWKALTDDPTIGPNVKTLDARLQAMPGAKFVDLRDAAIAGCVATEFEDSHHPAPACAAKVVAALFDRGAL